jgi:hypothetical protein
MAKLTYTAITSLDGYVADEQGNWDWSAPSEEVHAFVNDLIAGRVKKPGVLLAVISRITTGASISRGIVQLEASCTAARC